jgi:hypothetical protein
MKKYQITIPITGYKVVTVTAQNIDDAIEQIFMEDYFAEIEDKIEIDQNSHNWSFVELSTI